MIVKRILFVTVLLFTTTLVSLSAVIPPIAQVVPTSKGLASEPVETSAKEALQGPSVITLITSDRVHVMPRSGNAYALAIERGPNREGVQFFTRSITNEDSRDITVLPSDAAPLVDEGLLDSRLFNISELLRQGYDDRRNPDLPLIMSYDSSHDTSLLAGRAQDGAKTKFVRSLPSINGVAVTTEKRSIGQFWSSFKSEKRISMLASGLKKVWLDGRLKPMLDKSRNQIGVPAARAVGLTGEGITVAVLDT